MGVLAETSEKLKRWFCECVTEDGEEVILIAKGYTEAHASEAIHMGYCVDYIIDIMTPLQMEYKRRHLRPSLINATYYHK